MWPLVGTEGGGGQEGNSEYRVKGKRRGGERWEGEEKGRRREGEEEDERFSSILRHLIFSYCTDNTCMHQRTPSPHTLYCLRDGYEPTNSSLDPLTWHRCRCRTLGASLPGSSTSAGTGSPSHTLTWPALWHASPRDINTSSHYHAAQELYIQHVNTSLLHRHTTIQLAYMSCGRQSLR